MIEILMYSNLTCAQASEIIQRTENNKNMNFEVKKELIFVIQESTPKCSWDAND